MLLFALVVDDNVDLAAIAVDILVLMVCDNGNDGEGVSGVMGRRGKKKEMVMT